MIAVYCVGDARAVFGSLSDFRVCLFVMSVLVCWVMLFCLFVFGFGFWCFELFSGACFYLAFGWGVCFVGIV